MSDNDKELEDSDTESLPDISQIIAAPPVDKKISKGDIVWAKFKNNLYWPALVRAVYEKEKKISVWYTDDPGKTFKLPLKNVCSFHDTERRIKIERDVREAACLQEHEGLTSHALRYLKRKAEGYVDDPMKYFDQTYPFFLVEELLKNNPNADVSGIKIPPLYLDHEKNCVRKRFNVQNATTSVVESDIESVCSNNEYSDDDVQNEDLTEVQEKHSSVSSEDEDICRIVDIIKSGKADDYLKRILQKHVPSEHRDLYEREIIRCKKSTTSLTYTGPVHDDKKVRELIFYLLPLYASMTSIRRSKRNSSRKCKVKVLECPSLDKKCEGAQYVASVWLPEAIIYAMSHIYDVSLTEAKQLFEKKSEIKDTENILPSIGSEVTTSNSEIIMHESTCDEQGGDKTEICSPMKKLCVGRHLKRAEVI